MMRLSGLTLNASIELHLTSKTRNFFYAEIVIFPSWIKEISRDFFILDLYFIDLYQQNEEYINSKWNVLGREFI